MSTAFAGLLLIGVEFVRSLPALRRIRRTGVSHGVSGTSLGILAGTGVAWLVLAILVQSWWVLAANGIWIAIHVLLCREVSRSSIDKKRKILFSAIISTVVFSIVTFAAQFFMPLPDAIGLVLGVSTLFYAVPAVREGLTSVSTQGLSLLSLGVNTIEGGLYLLAGTAILPLAGVTGPILGFVFFGIVSLISNGTRFVRVSYRRANRLDTV